MYYTNINTNEVCFSSVPLGTEWRIATQDEIDNIFLMSKAKSFKLSICKQYLADTDWYVTRNIETDFPIPKDITDNRAFARTAYSDIESLQTLKEVEDYDISRLQI